MSLFSPWRIRRCLSSNPEHSLCFRRTVFSNSSRLQAANNIKDNAKEKPLPPLNRPLGVRQRPTTLIKTTGQILKDLMDQDARMAQRRHLIKEAGKGYFHDMNMTRKHGGKTWIAPNVLIREDKALYFPNVSGRRLEDSLKRDTSTMCFGRITLLSVLGTQISQVHAKGFVENTHARYFNHPLYQYIQINLQENLLKAFLVKLFSNSLRASVPPELHSTYLVSNQNLEYVRDPLGMTNSKVGYVYLVDENLKIRWGGCADATSKEAESLERCTGVLLKRLEEIQAQKPKEAAKGPDSDSALSSTVPVTP